MNKFLILLCIVASTIGATNNKKRKNNSNNKETNKVLKIEADSVPKKRKLTFDGISGNNYNADMEATIQIALKVTSKWNK